MQVNLLSSRIQILSNGSTFAFDGQDLIGVAQVTFPAPRQTTPTAFVVRLYLTGEAGRTVVESRLNLAQDGKANPWFDIDLSAVENQPDWPPSPKGVLQAVADITPLIRYSPSSGGGQVDTIVPGDAIDVDSTDPVNPIVNVKVDGVTMLINGSNELEAVAGTGDVVGPASAVNNHIPQFDGTSGKLIKDGLATSLGGNGAADSGKVVLFNAQGQLIASSSTADALLATATASGATGVHGVSTGASNTYGVKGEADDGFGVHGFSTDGSGVWGWSINGYGGFFMSNSATLPALHALATGGAEIMHFEDGGISPALIVNANGGLVWRDTSAAQTTVNGLPVFGALTKGVVPAAGAVPAATNFLTETGVFAVPAGTGVPTSRTISTTAPLAGGGDLSANRTLSIAQATSVVDGFLAASDWVIFNAKQAAISFGTGVLTALGVNVGTAGAPVINGGALGTPSSGTLTNATGLPVAGIVGLGSVALLNEITTVSRVITQTTHGFTSGDLVKYTGSAYAKALADVEANAEVVGIVSAVAGVNDFTLTTHGYVTGLSGLTSGTTYFLSEITAGLLTATAPSTTLNVRKAQLIALSTTTGHYNNFVGYIIP